MVLVTAAVHEDATGHQVAHDLGQLWRGEANANAKGATR